MKIDIPNTLLNNLPVSGLTEQQVMDFQNRLNFIASISSRYNENVKTGCSAQEILNELELDLSINMAMPSMDQNELTAFFIHTSWSSETDDVVFADLLDNDIRRDIFRETGAPNSFYRFQTLVEQELITLDKLVVSIESATEFDRFLAILIGIDCILARMLHSCYTMRLLCVGS